MIQIKRNNEIIITLSECPEGAVARYELMKEDYVSIKFSLEERIDLKIGDYAEIEGFKRYELVNPYSPAYNENTGGFDYDLRLDAYYYAWRNRIVRYIPNDSASETSFHLTSSVTTHLNVIINGLNGLGYNFRGEAYRYELRGYDKDLSVSKYKEYQNEDFISALSSLAELFECEWWVEQNTIFFGKLKDNNDPVTFEVGNNVSSISAVENDGDFATRIIAFGSDRNIAATYRKNNSADVVVNGIVTKRLMLPLDECPNGYVDRTETGAQAVEMVIVNEDIYPRVECVTSEVLTDTITSTDEEGKEIEQVIYRLKDKSGFNFSTEYRLEGQELHILFVSGKMNGMDFECIYSDEDKYYEVVINENYGRALPDENLHPEIEDKFVIYGWDSSKIADTGIIDAAEEELYNYAVDILDGMQKDKKTYNCKMFSVYSEDYEQYDAGRKVNLVSPSFGERESRIIGYEIKLDIPNDSPMYIVGEYVKYTKTETLQKQIDSIVVNGVSYKGVRSGGGVTIITSSSSLTPSDSNVFSAKMSDKRYIRRDIDDETDTILGAKQFVAKEKVVADRIKSKTEDAPVVVENDLSVEGNSSVNGDMNVEGKATVEGEASIGDNATLKGGSNKILGDVTFGKEGTDTEYTEGVKGCKIYFNGSGWAIDTDYLSVNKRMYAKSIQVDEVDHVGGQIILTDASCVADKVAETEEYYRVYFRAKDGEGRKVYNQWRVGDQAYCQIFNIDKGVTEDFTNRYYWRLVVGVGSGDEFHYIDLSKSVYDISGDLKMDNDAGTTPMPDDPIVQLGYRRQSGDDDEFVKQRQGATMISGGGRQGRSIRMWEKIDSFILPEPRVLISPSNVEMTLNKLHIKTTGDDEEAKDVIEYVQEFQEQFHIFELDTNEIPTLENEPYITWTEEEKVRYSTPPNNAVVINADGRTWRFIVTDGVYSFEEFTDPWLLAQHKDLQTILDDNVIAADELITLIRLKTELEKESVEVESEKNAAKVDVTAAYNEWKTAFDLLKEVVDDLTAMNPPILLDGYKGELNGVSSPHSREELSGAFNNHTVALYKWQAALRDAGLDKVEGEIEQAAQDIYNIMSDNVVTADEVNRIKTIAQEMQAQYNEAVAQRNTLDEARFAKVESVYNALVAAYNAIEKVMQGLIAAETPIQLPVTIEDVSYTRDNINSLYADYAKSIYEWQSVYQKIFSDEALDDISRIFDDNIITADELKEINKAKAEIDEEKANVDAEYNELGDKQDALDAFYQNYVNAYNALGNLFAVILSTSTPIQLKTENEDGDIQYTREEINLLFADYASALIGWQSAVPKKFVSDVQEELDDILDDNVITEDEVSRIITIKGEVVSEYAIAVSQKATLSDKQYSKVSETFDSMEDAYNALVAMFDAILAAETPIHLGTEEFSYTREGINTLYSNYAAGIYEWQSAYQKLFSDEALSDISKILDDNVITADEMLVFARLNNTLSSEKSSVTSQYNDAVAKAVIDTAPLTSAYNNYITAVDGLMATLTGLINLDTPVYLKDYTGGKDGGSSTDVSRADIEEVITFHSSAYQKWVHDVADFNNEGNSALLEEILSDNIISANEKPTFIEMGKRIAQESVQEKNKYQAITSPSTALTTAYTNYTSAMTTLMTVLASIKNLTPPIRLKTDTEAGDITYTRDGLQSLVVTYDVRLAAWRDAYEDFKRDKSSIDTLQGAKDYTDDKIADITSGTIDEHVNGLISDYVDGKFTETNSKIEATKDSVKAITDWIGEDAIGSTGMITYLRGLFVGTSTIELDAEGKITNYSKAGLVTTTNFASVFAEETGKDGETVSAIISAFVKDETSNIVITADNVFIASGSPALSNYFMLENGNVTMQDLYCRNITVEGVINNLVDTITTDNRSDFGVFDSVNGRFFFNPLKCGSTIIVENGAFNIMVLPVAFNNGVGGENGTEIEGYLTLQELRQCVGKRFWILDSGNNNIQYKTGTGDVRLLLWRTTSFDTSNTMDMSEVSDDEQEIVTRAHLNNLVAVSGDYMQVVLECKMGIYNGHECIYWELESAGGKLT